jgi:hypothetical protein
MKIKHDCELLQKEFPSFTIHTQDNRFIVFDTSAHSPNLFLRDDYSEYKLSVTNPRGGYLLQCQIGWKITQKDIKKIRETITRFNLGVL